LFEKTHIPSLQWDQLLARNYRFPVPLRLYSFWALNILEKFEGRTIRWGIGELPLIDGDKVI